MTKVTFTLTGINGENVVAKFQSDPFTVSDDIRAYLKTRSCTKARNLV